ncbi:uncharacterized protein LOC100371166 [Saccoglossus kowalevskii]|uniref:Probable ATP-dependent RNA helicase ddx17-like n=1 Tax=Saccoglossus kowalevskii TaxID=10224 RepID=A0ABM0GUY1_SACKO|nr:PREDICTED: probable ATP-dependent RNA helicase ddx17-like [Saccoglossus kowalevskii]
MEAYNNNMRDLEHRIEERDRQSEISLRELFQTRRRLWNMYPRVGALEDRLYMRESDPDKYETLTTLDKASGSYTSPTLRSYGSVGDLSRDLPRTRTRRASADYNSYSRPLGRSYGTSSATDRFETSSVRGYRPGDDDDDNASLSGTRSYRYNTSGGDKWETQSLVDYPTTSYSGPRSSSQFKSKYGSGTGASSAHNYKPGDDVLENVAKWKTSNSASRRNYLMNKKYDEWSSPRYSPRAPLNPYLHEADLTTSYQSARTLVQPEFVDDDDEELENVSLARYNKVSLVDNYSYEPSRYYGYTDSTTSSRSSPKDTKDYGYTSAYTTYGPGSSSYKPKSRQSTQKYKPDDNLYGTTTTTTTKTTSRPRSYSYTSGYSSTASPTRYSKSRYDDDDKMSEISSVSAYEKKSPRMNVNEYLSARKKYTNQYDRDSRVASILARKPRSSYPIYSGKDHGESPTKTRSSYSCTIPVGSSASSSKFNPDLAYLGESSEEYERDPLRYLLRVLNAQSKVLTYCVNHLRKQ